MNPQEHIVMLIQANLNIYLSFIGEVLELDTMMDSASVEHSHRAGWLFQGAFDKTCGNVDQVQFVPESFKNDYSAGYKDGIIPMSEESKTNKITLLLEFLQNIQKDILDMFRKLS